MLDAQGLQTDLEAFEEENQETVSPTTIFSEWDDDINNGSDQNRRNNDCKFRPLELQSHEQLLLKTKSLESEQMLVLQKVLDMVKTTVQCRNSKLARDSPHQMGLIVHGGGGNYFNLFHIMNFYLNH